MRKSARIPAGCHVTGKKDDMIKRGRYQGSTEPPPSTVFSKVLVVVYKLRHFEYRRNPPENGQNRASRWGLAPGNGFPQVREAAQGSFFYVCGRESVLVHSVVHVHL